MGELLHVAVVVVMEYGKRIFLRLIKWILNLWQIVAQEEGLSLECIQT